MALRGEKCTVSKRANVHAKLPECAHNQAPLIRQPVPPIEFCNVTWRITGRIIFGNSAVNLPDYFPKSVNHLQSRLRPSAAEYSSSSFASIDRNEVLIDFFYPEHVIFLCSRPLHPAHRTPANLVYVFNSFFSHYTTSKSSPISPRPFTSSVSITNQTERLTIARHVLTSNCPISYARGRYRYSRLL
ncbi:hypothetical protein J6590_003164 [Homalodisca vitripennis]|nr:hypothetical protein J6590_003164 [Homalodisca vitripennis]